MGAFTHSNARQAAWEVLRRWSPDGLYAEELVDRAAVEYRLSGPDRGLLNAIVLGVLRHQSMLERWVHYLRDGASLEDDVHLWLEIGLVQLHILGLPEHAGVNETVSLAGRARGLVNAVLRRSLREKDVLMQLRREAPPEVRFSLPAFLVKDWTLRFGTEGMEQLGEWCNSPAPVFVRVNGLKPEAAAAVAALRGAVPFAGPVPGFYQVEEPPRTALGHGLCYAQDPSTGMAPAMLGVQPGQVVLDACAAPGGKTAMLAEAMRNTGTLVATDMSRRRVERLQGNMARMGAAIVETVVQDWEHDPEPAAFRGRFAEGFDRILLDVPCSNSGVLRRRVDARWRLEKDFFAAMAETQQALLMRMLGLLKPGGRLVYSTCSIEPQENTGVVETVLQSAPGWRLLEEKLLLPHRDGVDGAYAALIQRDV